MLQVHHDLIAKSVSIALCRTPASVQCVSHHFNICKSYNYTKLTSRLINKLCFSLCCSVLRWRALELCVLHCLQYVTVQLDKAAMLLVSDFYFLHLSCDALLVVPSKYHVYLYTVILQTWSYTVDLCNQSLYQTKFLPASTVGTACSQSDAAVQHPPALGRSPAGRSWEVAD